MLPSIEDLDSIGLEPPVPCMPRGTWRMKALASRAGRNERVEIEDCCIGSAAKSKKVQ